METAGLGTGTVSATLSAPRFDAVLTRGAPVGRYLVLERLGAGAAGVVYSAYDPRLDRRIALKFLRESAPRSQARFLREMRALAQLQHRNVVTLYDAAEIDGQSFLAMELCSGGTLAQWCADAPRTCAEILGVFLEAGEGLAAAHAAGFVHRDFKPANVLIASDGHPRVGDFGLVRATVEAPTSDESHASQAGGAPEITAAGGHLGTLAYMASEQLRGDVATPASDQFAYCVSLYGALFGQRPFAGEDAIALAAAIERGPELPPTRTRTEQRLLRVLRRGLALAPEARFGSMNELLGELRRAGHRPARRRAAIAAAVVAIAAGVVLWSRGQDLPCGDAAARMRGVWDPALRAGVAAAFYASGREHAGASLALLDRALDEYATAWVTMHDEACRATHERHEQSPQLLDLRMSCLEDRREELRAFTAQLLTADRALVDRAASNVGNLSSVARCSDAAGLLAVLPPPEDPALRARIEAARAGLARVNALWVAGKLGDAHREAAPLLEEAKAIGYAPLQAEVLFRTEQIDARPPDLKAARAQLRDAIALAEAGHDQEMQLLAWAALPFVQAVAGDRDAAIDSMRHGEALLDGLGRPLRLEALVMASLGAAASAANSLADAERWQLRALRARERLYPPGDPALGSPHVSLGNIYQALGRNEDSLRHGRAALEIYERAFGDAHFRTCAALIGVSGELEQCDQLDEALHMSRRAVTSCERAFGRTSAAESVALMNESNALQRLARFAEALPVLLQAKAISDVVNGPSSPEASALLSNLASLRSHLGELDAALLLIDRALAIAIKSLGPDSARVRHETETKVELLLLARRAKAAIAPAERYRDLAQQVPDGDVRGRLVLGRALVAAGRLADARALLSPIFNPAHPLTGKPVDVAAARLELARALDGDPAQSKALEHMAREALAKLGRPGQEMLSDLDSQLPAKPRPDR